MHCTTIDYSTNCQCLLLLYTLSLLIPHIQFDQCHSLSSWSHCQIQGGLPSPAMNIMNTIILWYYLDIIMHANVIVMPFCPDSHKKSIALSSNKYVILNMKHTCSVYMISVHHKIILHIIHNVSLPSLHKPCPPQHSQCQCRQCRVTVAAPSVL